MKIVTSFDFPPIPDRSMDWSAVDEDTYDGTEDSGPLAHLIGRGRTEADAIRDLREAFIDHDLCPDCGRPDHSGLECGS